MFHLFLPSPHLSLKPPVWGFSFLSVSVINAFALTGVFIVPLMKTRYMKRVLTYFIALAVGTLFSTAILQLLPEVCHPPTPKTTHFHIDFKRHTQKNLQFTGIPQDLINKSAPLAQAPLSLLRPHLFPLLPAFVFSLWLSHAPIGTLADFVFCLFSRHHQPSGGVFKFWFCICTLLRIGSRAAMWFFLQKSYQLCLPLWKSRQTQKWATQTHWIDTALFV